MYMSGNQMTLVAIYVLTAATVTTGMYAGLAAETPAEATVEWDADTRVLHFGENETVMVDFEHPERMELNETNSSQTNETVVFGDGNTSDEAAVEPEDPGWELPAPVEDASNATVEGYMRAVQRLFIDSGLSFAAPLADDAATWAYHNDHWLTPAHVRAFHLVAWMGPFLLIGGQSVRTLLRERDE